MAAPGRNPRPQAVLFACGVFIMVAFVRAAQRVEPFLTR